jgi:hypothetical protein
MNDKWMIEVMKTALLETKLSVPNVCKALSESP